jgi:hypothetical protein
MFKKILFAAAFVMASSPAFVSAQDFFFSFDEFSRVPTTTVSGSTATGSLFIFSDGNLAFRNLDLDFTNSDASVVAFTDATTFNAGGKFADVVLLVPNNTPGTVSRPTATDRRLFAFSLFEPGQDPAVQDTDFRPGASGFLLGQVDFDILGNGVANFDFILGDLGVTDRFGNQIPATFGSASVTVGVETVPEPSSAILLILGAVGMVARRRRS